MTRREMFAPQNKGSLPSPGHPIASYCSPSFCFILSLLVHCLSLIIVHWQWASFCSDHWWKDSLAHVHPPLCAQGLSLKTMWSGARSQNSDRELEKWESRRGEGERIYLLPNARSLSSPFASPSSSCSIRLLDLPPVDRPLGMWIFCCSIAWTLFPDHFPLTHSHTLDQSCPTRMLCCLCTFHNSLNYSWFASCSKGGLVMQSWPKRGCQSKTDYMIALVNSNVIHFQERENVFNLLAKKT